LSSDLIDRTLFPNVKSMVVMSIGLQVRCLNSGLWWFKRKLCYWNVKIEIDTVFLLISYEEGAALYKGDAQSNQEMFYRWLYEK
jgi:hypothetical protein